MSDKQKNGTLKKALMGVALVILAILAMSPLFLDSYHQKKLMECKTNLKELGMAAEMYSVDWEGHYPSDLEKLMPKYIPELPRCPNSDGRYQVKLGPDAPGNEPRFEDYIYIFCEGHNHEKAGIGRDEPAYGTIAYSAER